MQGLDKSQSATLARWGRASALWRRSSLAALATLVSRILGFVRDALIVATLSREVADAWILAFRLPNLARRLFGEGTLQLSVGPEQVADLHDRDRRELSGRELTTFVVYLGLLAQILASLLAYHLLPIASQSFAFVMGFYTIQVALLSLWVSLANARGRFFRVALAPAILNLSMIATMLAQSWIQVTGLALSWSVVIGGFLQLGWVGFWLKREGHLPNWHGRLSVQRLCALLMNFVPAALALGFFQWTSLMNSLWGTRFEVGAQSYLYLADRLLELPQSLLAVSVGGVLVPTLSHLKEHVKGEESSTHHALGLWLVAWWKGFWLLGLGAIGLVWIKTEIVELLFRHGAFQDFDVLQTARLLLPAGAVLVLSGLSKILLPLLFVFSLGRVAGWASIVSLLVHALGLWLWTDTLEQAVILQAISGGFFLTLLMGSSPVPTRLWSQTGRTHWLKTLRSWGVCALTIALVTHLVVPPSAGAEFSRKFSWLAIAVGVPGGLAILAHSPGWILSQMRAVVDQVFKCRGR